MHVLLAFAILQAAAPETVTFQTADGITVYGDLYRAEAPESAPILLLLHQSASNASEYAPIAPYFVDEGWHAVAIDARGGGEQAFGGTNRTVARLDARGGGREAYHDFKAALEWIRAAGFTGPIGIIGSSYSAGRMFQVLAERPPGVVVVAGFSPGSAFSARQESAPSWAEQTTVPVFLTWAPDEMDEERRDRFARVGSAEKYLFEQVSGTHGAATLRDDRNPQGAEQNRAALIAFLRSHLPRQ